MSKILAISPTPSHPQDAGNRARIFCLLNALQSKGQEIHFFFVEAELGDKQKMKEYWASCSTVRFRLPLKGEVIVSLNKRLVRLHNNLVVPFGVDDWYRSAVGKRLEKLQSENNYDVVIVNYVFLSKVLHSFGSDVLKIIDTHDVFGDRHKMFLKNSLRPKWFFTTPRQEAIGLRRANIILAIQESERQYFSRIVPDRQVLTVGHVCEISSKLDIKQEPKRLLYVGSNSELNLYGLKYFLKEFFPGVKTRHHSVELAIVGNICTSLGVVPPGCIKFGRVSDLSEMYARCSIVINPILFGTGLKIKNIEALSYGKPLVTTPVGAQGMQDGAERAFLIAKNATEFIDNIHLLLADEEARVRLSASAFDYIKAYNEKAIKPLLDVL